MAKFDGTRTIAYVDKEKMSVRLLNRRGVYLEDRYPEMKDLWKDVEGKRVILDGELVILKDGKPDFYLLEEREHVSSKTRAELLAELNPVTYVVFDILHKDGQDLIDMPLKERRVLLEKTVKESSRLLLSTYVLSKGREFFEKVREKGLEGIMAKRLTSTYQVGKRSKGWLKIKALQTIDCLVCGYTKGEGKREPYFGALLCGVWHEGKLRYVGRVGTGWDEKGLERITDILKKIETKKSPFEEIDEDPAILEKIRWVKPELIAEIRFMGLTEDLKMRAPAFVRLRNDKLPMDCTLK
jgi:bifunctional non-homologous end joining protein LigD